MIWECPVLNFVGARIDRCLQLKWGLQRRSTLSTATLLCGIFPRRFLDGGTLSGRASTPEGACKAASIIGFARSQVVPSRSHPYYRNAALQVSHGLKQKSHKRQSKQARSWHKGLFAPSSRALLTAGLKTLIVSAVTYSRGLNTYLHSAPIFLLYLQYQIPRKDLNTILLIHG